MTNAEAIGILALAVEAAKGRCFVTDEAISDAYGMAISALEKQESESKRCMELAKSYMQGLRAGLAESEEYAFVNGAPPCNQLATDTISRQAAIRILEDGGYSTGYCKEHGIDHSINMEMVRIILNDLPSAQSECKTGKWLIRKFGSDAQCSECKMFFSDAYDLENSDAYCRHCGAKMEGLKLLKKKDKEDKNDRTDTGKSK